MTRFLIIFFLLFPLADAAVGQSQPDDPIMSDQEINSRVAGLGKIYKLDSARLASYDKIITFEKEVYLGKVYNITFSDVRYTCPPDNKLTVLRKSDISQILYADGRRDLFIALDDKTVKQKELVDTARIIIKNQKDWMKVIVTENPAEIQQLAMKGNLKASFEAETGNASNEDLMRGANIILKKKAAVMQAHCVLVETKFFKKSYGDLPRVEVTARAFGY
jgi:hypothetical protein